MLSLVRTQSFWCVSLVATTLALSACGSAEVSKQQAAIDRDGNGLCDEAENMEKMVMPPPPSEAMLAPSGSSLKLTVNIAKGVALPRDGRVALLISMPSIGELSMTGEPPLSFELFSTPLPQTLPGPVDVTLQELPKDLVDQIAAVYAFIAGEETTNLSIAAQVIVYDDHNGDGHGEISDDYLVPPSDLDDPKANDAFMVLQEQWQATYGQLDFVHLSNPADPKNEVISQTNISLIYRVDQRQFEVVSEATTCQQEESGTNSCKVCSSVSTVLDPSERQAITIGWALPRS